MGLTTDLIRYGWEERLFVDLEASLAAGAVLDQTGAQAMECIEVEFGFAQGDGAADRMDVQAKNGTRSRIERVNGNVQPGSWRVRAYMRPPGGGVAPDYAVLLEAAYGDEAAVTAPPADGQSYTTQVRPTKSLVMWKGAQAWGMEAISGAIVQEVEYGAPEGEIPYIEWRGIYTNYHFVGTATAATGPTAAANATFTLDGDDAYGFFQGGEKGALDAGASTPLIPDQHVILRGQTSGSSEIAELRGVDKTTGVMTLGDRGLKGTIAVDFSTEAVDVLGYTPNAVIYNGNTIDVEQAKLSLDAGATFLECLRAFTLTYNTGLEFQAHCKGNRYPNRIRHGKVEASGSMSLLWDTAKDYIKGYGNERIVLDIQALFGDTASGEAYVQLDCTDAEIEEFPTNLPEVEDLVADITFQAYGGTGQQEIQDQHLGTP